MTLKLLEGVRVLELAIELPGNQAPSILADLGADVIKIEPPPYGDYIREVWPLERADKVSERIGVGHLTFNRNKRSLTLDLRQEAGRKIFYTLLETTDVVFDLSIPGTRAKLGVDYESCRSRKPDIVYVSLSGFGATGPYADIPSHGYATPGILGKVQAIRQEDGTFRLGQVQGGASAPPYAAIAMLAGLVHRNKTGQGCWLETSLVDPGVYGSFLETFSFANPKHPHGTPSVGSARYTAYETGDGKMVLFMPLERKFWERFCAAVARPDLVARYGKEGTAMDYGEGDQDLALELTEMFKGRTQRQWIDLCREARVPCTPLGNLRDLLADKEFVEARESIAYYEEPRLGDRVGLPSFPLRRPGYRFKVERPAPDVGQHNDELLSSLGYSSDDIRSFREARVIFER